MAYKSIMVHLDREPDAARRLVLAKDLAIRFNAALLGVAAREPRAVPPSLSDMVDDEMIEAAEDEVRVSIASVERLFRDLAGQGPDVRFRSGCCAPLPCLTRQARLADLVVVGRKGASDAFDPRFGVDPGALTMAAGRPVLVVPPTRAELLARRVLVAWKDTRECRRALADSLPLLRLAEHIRLVTSVDDSPDDQGLDDALAFLSWHGIAAEGSRVGTEGSSVADTLFEIARAEEADLIVAGAYGHSRVQEWLFGGVTRRLVADTPVPCLLSH